MSAFGEVSLLGQHPQSEQLYLMQRMNWLQSIYPFQMILTLLRMLSYVWSFPYRRYSLMGILVTLPVTTQHRRSRLRKELPKQVRRSQVSSQPLQAAWQ